MDIDKLAGLLAEAEKNLKAVPLMTALAPDMSVQEAYALAKHNIDEKTKAGEQIAGFKIGLTSPVVQKILGATEPAYGYVTASGVMQAPAQIKTESLISPKLEGEISFVLKSELKGPGITDEDVMAAADHAVVSMELLDSRYGVWQMKLQDMIADNGSFAGCILGAQQAAPDSFDQKHTKMTILKNGEVVAEGMTEAVLGSPAHSAAVFANMMAEKGISIPAGSIIMTGAPTPAIPVAAGDEVLVRFEGVGEAGVRFI